ncbi:MAG: FMN-binding protein, partial [Planctomycetaceae bacterium]|nr:FMN-binding protein [Planctomycetaceae bacterium]
MSAESTAPGWPSLPIVTVPNPPRRRRWTWRDAAIRSYRVAVLATAAYLLLASDRQVRQQELGPAVTLAEARRIFPAAGRLGPRDLQRDGHLVLGADGAQLGFVLKTAPYTDDLIGYAGPSNLLIGLSVDGRVVRVLLLSSGDTPAHVAAVRDAPAFWLQFRDRGANGGRESRIDAVSGSTLTSLAMAEGIQRRLSGPSLSLRFPDEVTLAEVQGFFPQATNLKSHDPRHGWTRAVDAADATLGYVVRTSPATDGLIGYAGPTETLFAVAGDQQTISGVRLRKSYDTPEYVERVRGSEDYFQLFQGKSLAELREIDFVAAGIEGVSGATQTSYAVAEGLRRRALADARCADAQSASSASFRFRDGGLAAFIIGALGLTFLPWKKDRRLRAIWQLLLIAGFGLWFGDLLSLSLLAGWARHGLPIATAPILVVLVGVSLFIPWTTKQQIYCHQLCPHGAAQEWLGRFRRWHLHLPSRVSRALGFLPGTLLAGAFLLAVMSPRFDLAVIEPFDGWILKTGAAASFTIAIVSLAAAIFVPQAYCRYGCP